MTTHTVTVRTKSGRYFVAPGQPSGQMFQIQEEVKATLDPDDRVVETASYPEDIEVTLEPEGFFA